MKKRNLKSRVQNSQKIKRRRLKRRKHHLLILNLLKLKSLPKEKVLQLKNYKQKMNHLLKMKKIKIKVKL